NFVAPKSRLHLNDTSEDYGYAQWTNASTGAGTQRDGFRIGVTIVGTPQLRAEELNTPIQFMVAGKTALSDPLSMLPDAGERMRIVGDNARNEGRVSISMEPNNPITEPLTTLHIGM